VFRFDIGGLISLLINLFIESIMNFVAAIAWPVYWLGRAQPFWLWLIVAYAGYWLGVRAAQKITGEEWHGGWRDLVRSVVGREAVERGDGRRPASTSEQKRDDAS
jgi:hypothetical protein